MAPPAVGPVVFIGLMATGKSAVGASLAGRLGWNFIDTDQLIVSRHGRISTIFSQRGERTFRKLEAAVVAEVLSNCPPETVISLGGGAVLDEGTQKLLGGSRVVFLDADLATVRRRIIRDRSRPLLAGDPVEAWTRMDSERRPVYERLADWVLDTRGRSIEQLVIELTGKLQTVPGKPAQNQPARNQPIQNKPLPKQLSPNQLSPNQISPNQISQNEGDSHGR